MTQLFLFIHQRTQKTHFTLPQSQRDTKTAKSGKTQKSIPKSKQKAKSIDSGYDDDVSRRTAMSRQSLPDGPVIGQTRTFQGKFYDPGWYIFSIQYTTIQNSTVR